MPSAYPVRYRRTQTPPRPRGRGSQSPRAANDNYPPAANDNIPISERLPVAANDNIAGMPVGLPPEPILPPRVANALDRYRFAFEAANNLAQVGDLIANGSRRAYIKPGRGWTLIHSCPAKPVDRLSGSVFAGCLTGQAVTPQTSFVTSMTEWYQTSAVPLRFGQVRVWQRVYPGVQDVIKFTIPVYNINTFPDYDPLFENKPLPYPYWAMPFRKPSIMPQSWQGGYRVNRWQAQPRVSGLRNNQTSSVSFDIGAGVRPSPGSPPTHTRNPPGQNVKERKYRPGKGALAVWAGIGTATEALDLLKILYYAIPKKWRSIYKNGGNQHLDGWTQNIHGKWTKYEPPPHVMAAVVFNNMHHVDVSKAVPAYAKAQVTDAFYGRVSKSLNKSFKRGYDATGRPFGYDTGPVQFI